MFRFEHAINAFIPSREYFPVGYGQLGCSGFIVSDKNGCFVSRKTPAYLDYGEAAFQHVESLLADLIEPEESASTSKRLKKDTPKEEICDSASEEKKDSAEKMRPPPSVGVDIMDDEHEECTYFFNNLLENPTEKNLKLLYDVLKSHFDHEEELIMQYSDSKVNDSSPFSAINSHKKDHHRILNIAKEEMDRLNVCGT